MEKTLEKQAVIAWIEQNQKNWSEWHSTLWNYAEPAWREYKSAAWYVERLRMEGFEVEAGSGEMPTAFMATFRQGEGPTIGGYAEYDAVPGNCQKADTTKGPRAGLSPYAAGHTDPHSALGMGSLCGFLAVKEAMKAHNIQGTLKFFGEPAEKVRGSKPIHAAKGYYDQIDAFISFHPCYMLPLSNTTRWDTHCGACYSRIFTFKCDEPESWLSADKDSPIPAAHLSARAPGATDALCLMYTMTRYTKESMLPYTGGWTLNEAILTAGQATADNLASHIAQIQYTWRAPTTEMCETILQVLEKNANAAALASHCKVEGTWVTKSRPGLANHIMAELTYRNLELVGPPQWGDAAIQIAQEIQKNLGLEPMDSPFLDASETLIEPQEAERQLRENLPAWQKNSTSDDYTEMSWHSPTVRLYIGRPMLKPPPGFVYPDWVLNALGGIPACIDPMILTASKTIGTTVIELLTEPDILQKAKDEFVERTGGGIGGKTWMGPLLPVDFKPPIHFRWPEYVTTERGYEWWIPANESDDS